MRSRTVLPLVLTIIFALTALFSTDISGRIEPDPIPFGFTEEFWYTEIYAEGTQIDHSVVEAVCTNGNEAKLEVIIQFYPPVTSNDIQIVEDAGMEVFYRMTALPAVFARGNIDGIEEVARYERTFWIEHNYEMEYLMEMTTTTINASKTWNTPVIEENGKENPGIDGEGVTVVVLDSGIDAGHPDFDYGEKVVKNYKSDTDMVWREVENADTSSGHGTHCAGTVAGNGDASGGARRGVAPGAKLIGLSTGEAVSIMNGLGGLEWVYEHSRPGHTYEWEDPIKAVSNSWGPGPGDYNPQDPLSILCQRITFENNVIVVFAASNSGGDGTDIQTNPYGNVPSNIAVAAIQRDGSGVASFSSRGQDGIITTYPDVGAPGVGIESTAARRTMISLMTKQGADPGDIDPYYFAISGTSMATPHIAGVVALLWQAYPGLGISEVYEDAEQEKIDAGWRNDTRNKVHEIELILEASAEMIEPSDSEEPLAGNYVPQVNETGWNGQPFDYAQGYGLVQVDKAVAIALTLKELRTRDFDRDGRPDYPDATVFDAIEKYMPIMKMEERTVDVGGMYCGWDGEWSRFANQTGSVIPMNHDTSKLVYVPEGAQEMELVMSYDPWQTDDNGIASLYVVIDTDGDGRVDWRQSGGLLEDTRISVLDLSGMPTGQTWIINVEGRGVSWQLGDRVRESQFREIRSEFTISLNITMAPTGGSIPVQDPHAQFAFWKPLDTTRGEGSVNITRYIYDLGEVKPLIEEDMEEGGGGGINWLLILLLLALVGGAAFGGGYIYNKRKMETVIAQVREEGEKP